MRTLLHAGREIYINTKKMKIFGESREGSGEVCVIALILEQLGSLDNIYRS